jgi:hypothetical protein
MSSLTGGQRGRRRPVVACDVDSALSSNDRRKSALENA